MESSSFLSNILKALQSPHIRSQSCRAAIVIGIKIRRFSRLFVLLWIFSSSPSYLSSVFEHPLELFSARNIWAAAFDTIRPDLEPSRSHVKDQNQAVFLITQMLCSTSWTMNVGDPCSQLPSWSLSLHRAGEVLMVHTAVHPPVILQLALKSLWCAHPQHECRATPAEWPLACWSPFTSSGFHPKWCRFDINLASQTCWRLLNTRSVKRCLIKPCWDATQNTSRELFCQIPFCVSRNHFSYCFFVFFFPPQHFSLHPQTYRRKMRLK